VYEKELGGLVRKGERTGELSLEAILHEFKLGVFQSFEDISGKNRLLARVDGVFVGTRDRGDVSF
jgi:hypothetical protein